MADPTRSAGPGFLYWFASGSYRNHAQAAGVWDLLDGGPAEHHQNRGPDGGEGWVLGIRKPQFEPLYKAESQTWRKVAAGDQPEAGYWIGWWNHAKPTPADLARPELLPGRDMTLGDSQTWTVPLVNLSEADAQQFDQVTFSLNGDGRPTMRIAGPQERLIGLAAELAAAVQWDTPEESPAADQVLKRRIPDVDRAVELVAEVLACNYRINAAGVRVLELLSWGRRGNLFAVIDAMLGLELVAAVQKKTTPPASMPGSRAESAAIESPPAS